MDARKGTVGHYGRDCAAGRRGSVADCLDARAAFSNVSDWFGEGRWLNTGYWRLPVHGEIGWSLVARLGSRRAGLQLCLEFGNTWRGRFGRSGHSRTGLGGRCRFEYQRGRLGLGLNWLCGQRGRGWSCCQGMGRNRAGFGGRYRVDNQRGRLGQILSAGLRGRRAWWWAWRRCALNGTD